MTVESIVNELVQNLPYDELDSKNNVIVQRLRRDMIIENIMEDLIHRVVQESPSEKGNDDGSKSDSDDNSDNNNNNNNSNNNNCTCAANIIRNVRKRNSFQSLHQVCSSNNNSNSTNNISQHNSTSKRNSINNNSNNSSLCIVLPLPVITYSSCGLLGAGIHACVCVSVCEHPPTMHVYRTKPPTRVISRDYTTTLA